jgi:hypothetical protein
MRKIQWRPSALLSLAGRTMDAFMMGPPRRPLRRWVISLLKSKNGISPTERELAKLAEQRAALADRLNAAEIVVTVARRRAETLTSALTDIDRTAAELQSKLAQERDQRERQRVVKELETMSAAIDQAGRATNCALVELVNVLAGVSEVVVEGSAVAEFSWNAASQIEPALVLLRNMISTRASDIREHRAPANLISATSMIELPKLKPPEETVRLYFKQNAKWMQGGREMTTCAFSERDVPVEIGERATQFGIAVPVDSPQARATMRVKGRRSHPVSPADCLDLDTATDRPGTGPTATFIEKQLDEPVRLRGAVADAS